MHQLTKIEHLTMSVLQIKLIYFLYTCWKHFDDPIIKTTSLTRSDTRFLNSPKSSDSSGTPS